MTMLLSEAWDQKNFATGKASDIARQLAFAGIAVIWLFKTSDATKPVPADYLWPLWLFLVALLFDLIQYLYAGIAWSAFSYIRDGQHGSAGSTEIADASGWLDVPTWIFFGLKMAFMTAGYIALLTNMWAFLRP